MVRRERSCCRWAPVSGVARCGAQATDRETGEQLWQT